MVGTYYWRHQFKVFLSQVSSLEDEDMTFEDAIIEIRKGLKEITADSPYTLGEHSSNKTNEQSFIILDLEPVKWMNRTVSIYYTAEKKQIKIGRLPEPFTPKQYKKISKWIELYLFADVSVLTKMIECAKENLRLNKKTWDIVAASIKILTDTIAAKTGQKIEYFPRKVTSEIRIKISDEKDFVFLVSLEKAVQNLSELTKVVSNPEENLNCMFPCYVETKV